MQYTLLGRVSAQVCRDCPNHPVSGFLRLYVDAQEKKEAHIIDEAGLSALGGRQIGREEIDPEGHYKIQIDDRETSYKGGSLLAVFEVPFLPPMESAEKKHPVQYVILGTFKPEWARNDNNAAHFLWPIQLSDAIYCKLLALFDIWCLCGRVLNCDTQQPLVGLTVKAMDDDWIKEDYLGSAATDLNGYFRICFRSIKFKNTFLSPFINVETPLGGNLGPDVYFSIEAGGVVLLEENSSDGQKEGRKNRPNCSFFSLCVDFTPPNDETDPIRAVWTNVGTYGIPDFSSLHDFDADGYGGTDKYGFYSVLPLKGVLKPKSMAGNPVEYRFMVSHSTLPNVIGGPAVPAASFTPATFANGWFVGLQIGIVINSDATKYSSVSITPADMDAEGWVNIMKAIDRTFATDPEGIGITPADWASGSWTFQDNFYMAGLNTGLLTTAHSVPAYVHAGVGFQPADEWPIQRIAIRFENREVVSPGVFNSIVGNGHTLNSIVVSNDAPHVLIEAQNGLGLTLPCQEFDLPPKLAYTVYHPHLMNASLQLYQNGGGYNAPQNNAPLPLNNGSTRPGVMNIAGHRNIAPPMAETCIYIASLSYGLRLTTGESNWYGGPQTAIFYYRLP
ncbi:MAG: hypothetical protein RLZZ165_1579 [Bacteroidota bacterium]